MPKPKDENKINQIFKATLSIVAREGFSGLRMGDVAKEAKMATGTLYIYFKDKQTLINGLYLFLKQSMAAQYIFKEDLAKPYKSSFDAIWKKYFYTTLENPEASAFIEQYYRSPYFNKKSKEKAYQSLQPIYDLLERGKKEKLIKNIDNDLLMAQLNGPILDMVKMHQSGTLTINAQMVSLALQMAWDAIKK
jgi:AcrR family transcriptional regulator